MLEFKKVCDAFERLSVAQRELLLAEKSIAVFDDLCNLCIPGSCAVDILAGFLIGSVVADGKINEAEYLLIYPALVSCFGDDFDFASIKESFRRQKDKRNMIDQYTEKAVELLRLLDDGLKQDVIMLCLCVTSIDRKITLKEKRYIRRLCDAL